MSRRSYDDPQYDEFRKQVRNRDGGCKYPNCKSRKKLQVHHILPWSSHPHLRYTVANGITLCRMHHDMIKGKEISYAKLFLTIIKDVI